MTGRENKYKMDIFNSISANINYVKHAGAAYADAVYSIKIDNNSDNICYTVTAGIYDYKDNLIGNKNVKTISAEEIKKLDGDYIGVRLKLNISGIVKVRSSLKKDECVIAEGERIINNIPSYMDTSEIKLKPYSRFEKSERVGLGYIMGIDLPRLVAPSYEVHGLSLRYGETDDAVRRGDKQAGEIVRRYGGWEARGACKIKADERYTLAGEQMGHWLSSAAVFYNHFRNEDSILLTAASQNGEDINITPKDIHNKIEYVVDKLDTLQKTDIPCGWKAAVNKEYIGGCDEIPFLDCFLGKENWCGVYWVPWYNIHKIYQGLLDVYSYAEEKAALKAYSVLKKLADWAVSGIAELTDAQTRNVLNTEFGGMNEIFAEMYEITSDEVYKSAALRFTHEKIIDPLKTNDTDTLSGLHANTQIPKFIGAAKLYEQDKEVYASYRTACENFWYNVNNERCYAIGGNSLAEHFQKSGNEELGVKTCESCNTYNMMRLTEYLFAWEHKSEYMDWYERALYNHVLGQQEPETGAKMYFVSMVQGTHRIYEQKYNAWWCCTGTGMENPGRYTRTACFEDKDDLYINLYMEGIYNWRRKNLTFNIETDYPYSETVKITVTGGNISANIKLRAPKWVSGQMTVKLNGEQTAVSNGGRYVLLSSIKAGDVIELVIPMGIGVYESRDNKKIAYEYGPLVLAAKLKGKIKPDFEYIWEERNTACQQAVYPVLKTSDGMGKNTIDDITDYIKKDSRSDTFKFILAADRNSTGKPVELVPFADIVHNYYNIYFDIDTEIDEYGINLSNIQLDYVDPDGQQSELSHGMIQSADKMTDFRNDSVQGMDDNGQYRYAYGKNGFFKYNMLVDKASECNYLILRYYDKDDTVEADIWNSGKNDRRIFNVKFKIFADDTELIADGKNYVEVTNGKGRFINKLIEIPSETVSACAQTDLSTGCGIISVKLVPYDENSATVPFRRIYTTIGDPENIG